MSYSIILGVSYRSSYKTPTPLEDVGVSLRIAGQLFTRASKPYGFLVVTGAAGAVVVVGACEG